MLLGLGGLVSGSRGGGGACEIEIKFEIGHVDDWTRLGRGRGTAGKLMMAHFCTEICSVTFLFYSIPLYPST